MVDLITLALASLLFLGGLAGYVLKRLSVFEIKERRRAQRGRQDWYDQLERIVNGIEQSWTYSGTRPEDQDRERTHQEMEALTDELKEYRRHQLATDDMVNQINEIIHRWDQCRSLIRSSHHTHYYNMRAAAFQERAESLRELLIEERQSRVRSFLATLGSTIRDGSEKIRRWRFSRRSLPFSYEIYRALKSHLSDNEISQIADGESFLLVDQSIGFEAIHYNRDEDRYNPLQIDVDQDGEIAIIDSLEGYVKTESQLLPQLRRTDGLDTLPYNEIIPEGQSVNEFKQTAESETVELV